MTVYEMTPAQWQRRHWSPFWRWITGTGTFHEPTNTTPLPGDRYVERVPVDPYSVAEVDTPLPVKNTGYSSNTGGIGLPRAYGGYPSERTAGTPYQVGDSEVGWKVLRVLNAQYGVDMPVNFPMPIDNGGQWWVESNPTRNDAMALSNFGTSGAHYDAHVCVYDRSTGWYYEAIGYNVFWETVSAYGIWDGNGNQVAGRGVVASKTALSPYTWSPDTDLPHSLTLVVSGSDHAEPTWPWLGRRVTISEEAKDRIPHFPEGSAERVFADSVSQYPILISDHGGHNGFRYVAGSKALKSVDWQGWTLNLADLRPCDGLTGP